MKLLSPRSWFGRKSITVVVDYGKELYIPKDATGVCYHNPLGEGVQEIRLRSITLKKIPFGVTGLAYREYSECSDMGRFCDGRILDELARKLFDEKSGKAFQKFLGRDRLIFFFGTTFIDFGGEECVPFLNLSDSLPALRYLFRLNQPIDSHVPCYAAFLNQ